MSDLKELAENLSAAAHEILGNIYDAGQDVDDEGRVLQDVYNLQYTADELDKYLKDERV